MFDDVRQQTMLYTPMVGLLKNYECVEWIDTGNFRIEKDCLLQTGLIFMTKPVFVGNKCKIRTIEFYATISFLTPGAYAQMRDDAIVMPPVHLAGNQKNNSINFKTK